MFVWLALGHLVLTCECDCPVVPLMFATVTVMTVPVQLRARWPGASCTTAGVAWGKGPTPGQVLRHIYGQGVS